MIYFKFFAPQVSEEDSLAIILCESNQCSFTPKPHPPKPHTQPKNSGGIGNDPGIVQTGSFNTSSCNFLLLDDFGVNFNNKLLDNRKLSGNTRSPNFMRIGNDPGRRPTESYLTLR